VWTRKQTKLQPILVWWQLVDASSEGPGREASKRHDVVAETANPWLVFKTVLVINSSKLFDAPCLLVFLTDIVKQTFAKSIVAR
jgi:hypothetical protein